MAKNLVRHRFGGCAPHAMDSQRRREPELAILQAQAFVFITGERETILGSMPPLARLVAAAMLPSAGAADFAFAILVDRN